MGARVALLAHSVRGSKHRGTLGSAMLCAVLNLVMSSVSPAAGTIETDLVLMPDAVGASFGTHLGITKSSFGVAAHCRSDILIASGLLDGECSGSLRYTLDIFRYVPWVGVGVGIELRNPALIPRAELGVSYMLGFDDALTARVSIPMNSLHFRGTPRPVIGFGWSRRYE